MNDEWKGHFVPPADNFRHKLMAALVTSAAPILALAHPLEDAAQEAVSSCLRMDAASIDECANMGGRSSEHSAARQAVRRLYKERSAFTNVCSGSIYQCREQADWYVEAGMARVLIGPAQYLDRPMPVPRSELRR